MKLAQDYIKKIEKQLAEFGKKIDELNLKDKAEVKSKLNENKDVLFARLDESLKKVSQNIDSHLNEWETKIGKLKGKGKEEAKKEYEDIIKNIGPRVDEFNSRLQDLKKSGGSAWNELKTGGVAAWKVLKDSIKKAKDKF
ncbi:MAG: hypothetical protein V1874_01180 [Spirochaetota bacterium]